MATVTVPAPLTPADVEPGTTATADGARLRFRTGQVVRFSVAPAQPGTQSLRLEVDAPYGARLAVRLNGEQVAVRDLYSPTDEEEIMPYSKAERAASVTAPAVGSTPARLDPTPMAGRTKVIVTNPHADHRLQVWLTNSATAPTGEPTEKIEADWGSRVYEADPAVHLWARSDGAGTIVPVVTECGN